MCKIISEIKMLLMIEALLILAALGQDHRGVAVEKKFPLDMAENSVDDRYESCKHKMKNLVVKKYMKQETSNTDSDFANAWKLAEKNYKPPEHQNLTKNHSIAIYVYTNSGFDVYKEFNEADRNDKKKYKNKTYKWYSLHFLLTDAIQILNNNNTCYSTYRGTNVRFKQNVKNKKVRFGSFTSTSLNRNNTRFFGNVSCFKIYTCQGADVSNYSKLDREKEVLIPPYETFKVIDVQKRKGQNNFWCETVFTLKSSGTRSDLNCALFKKPAKNITTYYAEH